MRVAFFGTPALAVPCLERVAAAHEVAVVICQPDRPKGRSKKLVAPPVKVCAERLGLPVHQPLKLNDGAFEAYLREIAPDIGVVTAYGRMLQQPILDIPTKGWLNLHPSLLPRWRGASPIKTAIMAGDAETGVTIMRVIFEMDAGAVVLQESTSIDNEENAEELAERLTVLGADLMVEALSQVKNGTAKETSQDLEKGTESKIFAKEDGRIRWSASAQTIHNLVRAAMPWPMAHCNFGGDVYRIHRTVLVAGATDRAPGTVTEVTKERIVVATDDGQIAILSLQAPGKKAMATQAFLLGHRVQVGDRFEDII